MPRFRTLIGALSVSLVMAAQPAWADDGYALWLRSIAKVDRQAVVTALGDSATLTLAASELRRALPMETPAIVVATASAPSVRALTLPFSTLGDEGYLVRNVTLNGKRVILVAGNSDRGTLYGAFALIRHLATGGQAAAVNLRSAPKVKLRVLNHWDNLDESVERGYAGQSIWDWWTLPDFRDPRYTDYARANASIGINGTVLNNVNAKADSLTAPYIAKAAALADVFRPWGIRVYLSARFSAPIELGGLKTADPRDPAVAAWWKAKADEIYRAIPDFGGFLVKANSEGQPGPRDYGASHADGANMLAAAVRDHGGIVMWRARIAGEWRTGLADTVYEAIGEIETRAAKAAA